MKTMPGRLYGALPRRKLHILPYFDSPPPPPPSRPLLSTNRLPADARAELEGPPPQPNPPFSLALSAPAPHSAGLSLTQSQAAYSLFPYTPFSHGIPYLPPAPAQPDPQLGTKRPRLRYQLDVGAYGIPKRSTISQKSPPRNDELPFAVQVGEDAYFTRHNAMGVADGVGGWAKSTPCPDSTPTPSALFARRLMHFCSAELEATPAQLQDELDDALDELEQGIDVLRILQSAYDNTLDAHVQPAPPPPPTEPIPPPTPLLTGSSTALLAIAHVGDCMGMLVRGDEFNTPTQLGPHTPPPTELTQLFTLPDGLSDNLWDEEVLDEVRRMRAAFLTPAEASLLRRRTLAGMLSEALCSRARRVAEHRPPRTRSTMAPPEPEVPFARRAREAGKHFCGGKRDDISVLVAVISPATSPLSSLHVL
ncbi:hypothetical protein BD779DRAFT_1543872 [Infundibulicybe gibba]|nr:hypothetical protein BD779DRAFT_1543872 [Infundibulicybe gibba]